MIPVIMPRGHASYTVTRREIQFPPGAVRQDEVGVYVLESRGSELGWESWVLHTPTYYETRLSALEAAEQIRTPELQVRVAALVPATSTPKKVK